jgi:hypothetical protein
MGRPAGTTCSRPGGFGVDFGCRDGQRVMVVALTEGQWAGQGAHPVLADVELDRAGPAITARSPLRWNGGYGELEEPPVLGRETEQVLTEVLGLTAAELGRLRDHGVIAAP